MTTIQKSVIGFIFRATLIDTSGEPINISTATVKKIIFRNPSNAVEIVDAVFDSDGSDGKLKYTTVAGDIDEPGQWDIQGYVVMSSLRNYSAIANFQVNDNLTEIV